MTEKLSKKELKEDPFFEEVAHVLTFFQKNQRSILILAVVLAILLGGFFIGRSVIRQNEREASGYFGIAMDFYKKQDYLNAEDQFLLLAESYKNTQWGKRAYYYLGLIARTKGGSQAEGLDYMETFVGFKVKDPLIKTSAYQYIASVYESQNDYLSAAEYYMNAAKLAVSKTDKVDLGIRAAYAYRYGGNPAGVQTAVNYLESLELNEGEKNRVALLK
ncbi:MAG: hypothetical protein PHX07_04405 [Candidatus Marinimicrobia bacterium]|jgi:predicted Zn-dependent protease|nr:hypothetical protein [Candidatus Neomarinimicrobiota bacterium]MDD4961457.1 hypothetical protein [Candidatus Neomarinimicrobiota bacterium]MDD5709039.1 hypothetical protein [Candidatus Neomarinimicrobiota bacterium]MDX9778238.1 hypothetical protein [bacterium]